MADFRQINEDYAEIVKEIIAENDHFVCGVSDAPAREASLRIYTQAERKADLEKTLKQRGLYDFVADCVEEIASLTTQLPLKQHVYIQDALIKIRDSVAQAELYADARVCVDAHELLGMVTDYGEKIFRWSADLGYLDNMHIGELLTSIELAIRMCIRETKTDGE